MQNYKNRKGSNFDTRQNKGGGRRKAGEYVAMFEDSDFLGL